MAQDAALAAQAVTAFDGGTKIDVQQCYSCGGKHQGVACNEYRKANPPFTHWYACPTNGDPMPVAIVLYGGNPVELNNRVLLDVAQAQHGGSVIFATFGIDKRGGVSLQRHSHKFPTARLMEACDVLRKDLQGEAPLPEPVGPLPKADMTSLFGKGGPFDRNAVPAAHAASDVARNGAGTPDEEAEDDEEPDEDDDE